MDKIKITDKQIRELRTEAGSAGDADMVAICAKALIGDSKARRVCERAIRAAKEAAR